MSDGLITHIFEQKKSGVAAVLLRKLGEAFLLEESVEESLIVQAIDDGRRFFQLLRMRGSVHLVLVLADVGQQALVDELGDDVIDVAPLDAGLLVDILQGGLV